MGGFSDGDVVWCPSTKKGETMWPGVIVQATGCDDHARSLVRFIRAGDRHLDDILQSKPFSLDRSGLHLFDPGLAPKYAPESGKDCPSLNRLQFDKVVVLATKLFEERKKRVQEEYQLAVERATRRASDFGAADSAENPPVELAAGAQLFFWIPGMIAGRPEAEMYARVLTVYHPSRYEESGIPLELDSGHVLTMDDSVKLLKPIKTKLMPLRKFSLKTSSVRGARMADMICKSVQDQVDKLKAENPAYAFMIRDPFGSTRKQVEVGKQEAKDMDYTGEKIPRKKSKKKKRKPDTESRQHSPKLLQGFSRDRFGRKPTCSDSEEDDDDRMKYVPVLSVRNRPESQTSSSPSKPSLTPIRSKKPNMYDSDSDGKEDQKLARVASRRLSISNTGTRKKSAIFDNDCHDTDNEGRASDVEARLNTSNSSVSAGMSSKASITPDRSKPAHSVVVSGGTVANRRGPSGSSRKRKRLKESSMSGKNFQQAGIKAYLTGQSKESAASPDSKSKERENRVHDLTDVVSDVGGNPQSSCVDTDEGISRKNSPKREKIPLVLDLEQDDSDPEIDVSLKTRCKTRSRAFQQ